jgi:hypothetical protein
MEKVLQILAVFGLLMFVIWRSIRKEERFRRFSYLSKLRPPLMEEIRQRLVMGVFESEGKPSGVPVDVDGYLIDEESGLILFYRMDGKLTVNRRFGGGLRELQEMAVPMDCTGMAWDAQEKKIYLEEGGDFFVYGPEQ